jgi:dTDP-4-dehydrorhamnose reductase
VTGEPESTIVVTGGSGLLGSAFRRLLPGALYPSSAELDVRDAGSIRRWVEGRKVATIVHAAAFTSPPRIDQDPQRAIETNIVGTANLASLCLTRGWRLVYVSTDYVFRGDRGEYREDDPVYPVNRYAWSKLGGECAVRMIPNHLIIRTSFGPDVFPYPKAFVDQWTSRQGVSETARQVLAVIRSGATGTVHVGGPRRTVMEYARSLDPTKPIEPLSLRDVAFVAPVDTSLDTSRYRALVEPHCAHGTRQGTGHEEGEGR